MHITPAPAVPVGDPTDADRERARTRLSVVHGREVRGGHAVDELAWEYAASYRAGYEAAMRELAIPTPREATA